mmetsp:Transcript_27791/g.22982  ORF Transcript_27791/g.22982 Transcript_27791/m.22982 type:complete len:142 (+) Transcript_27791:175-600(+)
MNEGTTMAILNTRYHLFSQKTTSLNRQSLAAVRENILKTRAKQEKYSKITKSKLSHRVDSLCQGLPPEFADYLKRVRGLKFDEQPKYEELKGLMTAALVRSAHPSDEEHLDCKIMKNLQYQREQFEREKRAGALTPPGYYR